MTLKGHWQSIIVRVKDNCRQERVGDESKLSWGVMFLLGIISIGCGGTALPGGVRLKTYPVSGIVKVDGEPKPKVKITFTPQAETSKLKVNALGISGADGKFQVTTYEGGDGLPAGTYKLTFELDESESNIMGKNEPKDALKGAYSNVATSKFDVTVKDAKVDMGVIELSTGG